MNDESWPFMRGMLTHSLVQQGMEFKNAYQVAQDVKQTLSGHESITKDELRKVIDREIEQNFGQPYLNKLQKHPNTSLATIQVVSGDSKSPFSKGLVARSIMASGIPPNHAHQMAQELQYELLRENIAKITSDELSNKVYDKILNESGEETAQFYQLSSRINQLDRPVIVYIGGALGTGKSALATELASRLDFFNVSGTDMIRQIMRTVFTKQILPSLHRSTFEVNEHENYEIEIRGNDVLTAYYNQAIKVNVGVRAVVERAIEERTNVIIEGVHLLPTLIRFPSLLNKAYHIPVTVSLEDYDSHKSRFSIRQKQTVYRRAKRYNEHFENIRKIHDHYVQVAQENNIDLINNEDFDHSINRLVQKVITNLQKLVSLQESSLHLA